MDVLDMVSRKDGFAVNGNLNANLGGEGARKNPYPHYSRRGRIAGLSHANGVQTREFHPLAIQIINHSGTNSSLPDLSERVEAKGTGLLGHKVCIIPCGLNPDICA